MSDVLEKKPEAATRGYGQIAWEWLEWGMRVCRAAKLPTSDIVAASPELQAIEQEADLFGTSADAGPPEDSKSPEPVSSAAEQPQADDTATPSGLNVALEAPQEKPSAKRPHEDLAPDSAKLAKAPLSVSPKDAQQDSASDVVKSPSAVEAAVAAVVPMAANDPVAKPAPPTPAERAKEILGRAKALGVKEYLDIATKAEGIALKAKAKEIVDLCAKKTVADCDKAEERLDEMVVLLGKINSDLVVFDRNKMRLTKEVQSLNNKLGKALKNVGKAEQAPHRAKFGETLETYYEKSSEPRTTFDAMAVEATVAGMRDVVKAVAVFDPEEIANKEAEDYASFDPDDASTWNVQALRVVGNAIKPIGDGGDDAARIETASTGDNNSVRLIYTGGPGMHIHANRGSCGISFAYSHLGGNRVEPVIYAYASKRQGNDYEWKAGKPEGGPAAIPSSLLINRQLPAPT